MRQETSPGKEPPMGSKKSHSQYFSVPSNNFIKYSNIHFEIKHHKSHLTVVMPASLRSPVPVLTAAVAESLGRGTPWSFWHYGMQKVVSSIPGRGNIVGWVFHPTRRLARFSLIWICLSFQILNLFRTLSSRGSRNYSRSRLSSIT